MEAPIKFSYNDSVGFDTRLLGAASLIFFLAIPAKALTLKFSVSPYAGAYLVGQGYINREKEADPDLLGQYAPAIGGSVIIDISNKLGLDGGAFMTLPRERGETVSVNEYVLNILGTVRLIGKTRASSSLLFALGAAATGFHYSIDDSSATQVDSTAGSASGSKTLWARATAAGLIYRSSSKFDIRGLTIVQRPLSSLRVFNTLVAFGLRF